MVSFLAKASWERPRKSEKQKLSFWSFPTWAPNRELKKNSKKNSKNKKTPRSLLFNPKQVGKGRERVIIKIIVPIISYPTRYREFQKIVKKWKKWKKNTIMASFQAKTGWERPRTSENKNFRSEHFLPDS